MRLSKPAWIVVLGASAIVALLVGVNAQIPYDPSMAPIVNPASPEQERTWPATRLFESNGQKCTSTIVGPRAVLTAAHCLAGQSNDSVVIGGKSIPVTCESYPNYSQDKNSPEHAHDVAVCLSKTDLVVPFGGTYERIATPQTMPDISIVTLLGFGCRQAGGGGPSGSLYRGLAQRIRNLDNNDFIVVAGGGALCKGDSGGAAYGVDPHGRIVVAVNSDSNQYDTSLLAPVAQLDASGKGVAWFIQCWAVRNSATISGLGMPPPESCEKA